MAKSSVKVLVTGGRGFIGSNLVRELEKRGYEAWACDLTHAELDNYIRCDVGRFRQVERMLEEHDFDYVYHAAARVRAFFAVSTGITLYAILKLGGRMNRG